MAGSSPRPRHCSPGLTLSRVLSAASESHAQASTRCQSPNELCCWVPFSPPPSTGNEIIQRPPGGRLNTRLGGRRERISSCSAAAAVAAATTRHQPSHSAAMFARSAARAASAPAGSAPGSRGDEGGVGEFGCQRSGVPAPPPPQRRTPLATAHRPRPAAAAGSGCAQCWAQEPSRTPPRLRLARFWPLRFFPFSALHHLPPLLASFQATPQAS